MAYATNPEEAQIDSRVLDAIEPSMPPEFAQLRKEKEYYLNKLAEGKSANQAHLRANLLRASVRTIQLHDAATPDNYRAGIAIEDPGRSFRLQPKSASFRLMKERASDEASAKAS